MSMEGEVEMKESVKYLAGSAFVYAVVVACGGISRDVPEAKAEAPLHGNVDRVAGADTNPSQWVGGVASTTVFEPNAELAAGPFYLTDARAIDGPTRLYLVSSTDACDDTLPNVTYLWYVTENTVAANSTTVGFHPMHGARYLVNANQKLCLKNLTSSAVASTVAWAGFRPYD
jgi:hypothetical protein